MNWRQSMSNWNGIQRMFPGSCRKLGFSFLGCLQWRRQFIKATRSLRSWGRSSGANAHQHSKRAKSFRGQKIPSQVVWCKQNWLPFLVVALFTVKIKCVKIENKAVRDGNIFIFCSTITEAKQWQGDPPARSFDLARPGVAPPLAENCFFPFLGYLLLIYFPKRRPVLGMLMHWDINLYVVCLFLQYCWIFHAMLAWVSRVALFLFFCTHVQFLANVNSSSCSLYVIDRPSVCRLSVTLVHPTQAIETFGNVSTPCGTLAIHDLCIKILRRSPTGKPLRWGLNPRGVAKYSDFRHFEGYISETMQDMI